MTKKSCVCCKLVSVVFILAILFSAVFIAVEVNHDCAGDDCHVCNQIKVCISVLKNASLAELVLFSSLSFGHLAKGLPVRLQGVSSKPSLVSLNVKLSN